MDELNDVIKSINQIFGVEPSTEFVQYNHRGSCINPCNDCTDKNFRIYKADEDKPLVGPENHPHCDCFYSDIEEMPIGSISNRGLEAPDVYLKTFDHLPEYYITKEEAIKKYGWNSRRNTIAGKAPGKMIGGDVYLNKDKLLPIFKNRIWYECDVDYISGGRSAKRLFYSNDGLMFYSTNHGDSEFYYLK